jgi:hypothetical protein
MTSTASTSTTTGVNIKTSHVFFIPIWYFMKSRLKIDGHLVDTKRWGETFVALQPGQHSLFCYAQSFLGFGAKVGKSTTTIDVALGQVVNLSWKAPILFMPFIKGKWTVQAASVPAVAG